MRFQNKDKDPTKYDAVYFLMLGCFLVLLGMATGLFFFGFAGLGILIISVILRQRDGIHKPSLSFTKYTTKIGKKQQKTPRVAEDKSRYKERNRQRKIRKQSLEQEEARLIAKYEQMTRSRGEEQNLNDLFGDAKLFETIEDAESAREDEPGMPNEADKEARKKELQNLRAKIKDIQQAKEALQKEEAQDLRESGNVPARSKSVEESKRVWNSMNAFASEVSEISERYHCITLGIGDKAVPLIDNPKLQELENKKRFKRYTNNLFRRYCDSEVFYNEIFIRVGSRLVPIAMIDGVYLYRDTLRFQLCNEQIFVLVFNCNKADILQQVVSDFAQEVLGRSLIEKDKVKELAAYSKSRHQQMLREYRMGQLQPLDYILGDKII